MTRLISRVRVLNSPPDILWAREAHTRGYRRRPLVGLAGPEIALGVREALVSHLGPPRGNSKHQPGSVHFNEVGQVNCNC